MNKMSAVLKLLLLAAVTLRVPAQEWDNYESLPDSYRTHIDKALRDANEKFGGPHHVTYERLLSPLKITDNNLYVNVRLMVTTCKKEPHKGFGHRDDCITQKPKTPWIDCLVCKQENGEELIDCARQIDVRNYVWWFSFQGRDIRKQCAYWTHGGATVLSQKSGNNNQEFGCLGCV